MIKYATIEYVAVSYTHLPPPSKSMNQFGTRGLRNCGRRAVTMRITTQRIMANIRIGSDLVKAGRFIPRLETS